MMEKACPNEEMIADYLEGRLSGRDRTEMEAHLSDCESCLQEFVVGDGLVRGKGRYDLKEVPSRVTEGAVRLVKNQTRVSSVSLKRKLNRSLEGLKAKLEDLFGPVPWGREWSFAPIRGFRTVISKDHIHLRKTFREIDTEIEIEKTGENKAHIRVRFPGARGQTEDLRVTLKRGEREVSSYLLGRQGYVLFEDMPFGHYSLDFSRDGARLGTYIFEIKESQDG